MPHEYRDHSLEHPGCTGFAPWSRSCKRWKNPELLRRAAAEVIAMEPEARAWFIGHMREYRDHYRLRSGSRSAFIAAVEWYRVDDFDSKVFAARSLSKFSKHALTEVEIAHEAALAWNLHRQQLALAVQFAYGEER